MKCLRIYSMMLLIMGFMGLSAQETPTPSKAEQTVAMINQERTSRGLEPLILDPVMTKIAADWAQHMADIGELEHRDTGELKDFMKEFRWRGMSENVAFSRNEETPQQLVARWMKSEDHRENLLRPESRVCGLGFAKSNKGHFSVFNGAKPDTSGN